MSTLHKSSRLFRRSFAPYVAHGYPRSLPSTRLVSLQPSSLRASQPLRTQFNPQRWSRSFSGTTSARENTEPSTSAANAEAPRADAPAYEMTFTCKKCQTRSSHRISKQGYHHGTVLISCPGCKNRHLIADHLKIFSDTRVTLEEIMKEKGQLVKRGVLSTEGDVEFWDDGTETARQSEPSGKTTTKA